MSLFIFGADGRVVLASSPKWDIALLPPGGHVEPGELLEEAALREALEETGLHCQYIGVLNIGQMDTSFDKGYHRLAHFIYLHVLLITSDTKLVPQANEINTLDWCKPDSSKTTDQLNLVCQDSLKKANAYFRGEFNLIDIKN